MGASVAFLGTLQVEFSIIFLIISSLGLFLLHLILISIFGV